MEEENKNVEATTEPIEVLGNTASMEPVVEQPAEPAVEAPVEAAPAEPAVIETPVEPAPVVEPVAEPTPVVEATPAVEPVAPVAETPVEAAPVAPVEQPAEPAPAETPAAPVPTEPAVEPVAPAAEEPKKKGKGGLILIIILLLAVGGFAVWYFVLGGNGSKKEENKVAPDQGEKQEEDKKDDTKLTEAQAKEIYLRYHTELNGNEYIALNFTDLESNIYGKESFKVSELTEVGSTIANRIFEDIKDEIKDKEKTYPEDHGYAGLKYYLVADIEENVKKDFKKLFGNNLEYNINLFDGCHGLTIAGNPETKEKFEMTPQCGSGLTTIKFKYEMTGYEVVDDKLYITEKATTSEPPETSDAEGPTITEATYKWTYTKYEDTYVLLQVDKVNS